MESRTVSNDGSLKSLGEKSLLADRAHMEIQTAIFSRQLPPGTALSVPELARQLEISRSPVREAVQRLVHEGLAVAVPYKGAEVARVTVEDLQELYEVREMLEGMAARRVAEHPDEAFSGELASLLEEHDRLLAGPAHFEGHVNMDMRFHRSIREKAGNAYLVEALENLQGKVRLAMHSLWQSDGAPQRALADHRAILQAIQSGDAGAAETAARAHISRLRESLDSEARNLEGKYRFG